MLPPVLEIYVVWHPDDLAGRAIAREFFEHFHGTIYSGLIGGAIEVYARSVGWRSSDDAPRPIPYSDDMLPAGIPPARFIVVVPLMGNGLAAAVQPGDGSWHRYLQQILVAKEREPARIGIFPYLMDLSAVEKTELGKMLMKFLCIGAAALGEGETRRGLRCRDLAQGIAQMLMPSSQKRLKVFLSHTKRHSHREGERVDALIKAVREIIHDTRLSEFFDAADLQVGQDWSQDLLDSAATSAVLALRTDLYPTREWCQREMLVAKRAGAPIVIVDAIGEGEERGSFLMDHVPRVPARMKEDGRWDIADIRRALNLLVDEALKRELWKHQRELAEAESIPIEVAWWAPHAPEPITLAKWLKDAQAEGRLSEGGKDLIILHPDPPLGPDEAKVLDELVELSGIQRKLDILTPRLLAARGG